MPVTRCHNPKCRKPHSREGKFCSVDCRSANTRNRRRDRRHRQTAQQALHTETTQPAQAVYRCEECQAKLTGAEAAGHYGDDHDVVILSADRRCRECGRSVIPGSSGLVEPYCDDRCFLAFWHRTMPGKTAEQIAHSEQYALANGLTGLVEHRSYVEVFGTIDDPEWGFQLDPQRWDAENREAAELPEW